MSEGATMRLQAKAHAPASVGNVGVGFDILGHSLAGAGDIATVRRIAEPVVRITAIRGGAVDLRFQDYQDATKWRLVNLVESGARAHAYARDASIDAGGDLTIAATSDGSIRAMVLSASVPPRRSRYAVPATATNTPAAIQPR